MIFEQLNSRIQFADTVGNWKDAVALAAQPLLDSKAIEPQYIDAMIAMAEKHHGYIVLNDFFAMPHASPESGVNTMAVSMLIVKEAVDFFEKPVHIVLVLAPIDRFSHINIIQEVGTYFNDVEFIKDLAKSNSTDEIEGLLKKYYDCEVIINN